MLHLLDDARRQTLLSRARTKVARRGEVLAQQGEEATTLFLIHDGLVISSRTDNQGKEIGLALLAAGDTCGLEDIIAQKVYSCNYRIVSLARISRLPAALLLQAVATDHMLAMIVCQYLAQRLLFRNEHFEIIALEKGAHRVERWLSYIRRMGLSTDWLPITQEDLALLLGLSRQRVNSIVTRLKQSGILDYRRGRICPMWRPS